MAMRLIYLFAGTEAVLAVSGELRSRPHGSRGALGGLAVATFIYLGVQFAAQASGPTWLITLRRRWLTPRPPCLARQAVRSSCSVPWS